MNSADAAQTILLRRNLSDSYMVAKGLPVDSDLDISPRQRVERLGDLLNRAAEGDAEAWLDLGTQVLSGAVAAHNAEVVRVDTGTEAA